MKQRQPLRRKTPLRQSRASGPDTEREPKPWAAALVASTVKPIRSAAYGGSTSGQPVEKENLLRSEAYRRLVAALQCMVCGAMPCQAAHPNTGKGLGLKTDDRECFPLCPRCHARFDQGALFPKEARRELEPAWAAQTRAVIIAAGIWPARLPLWSEK